MKFDVIVMNPPYQDADNKRAPLWQKFAEKSFQLVKDGGFIASIHPCAWRKPSHELFELFKKNNVRYLEIHNQQDGLKTFGVGTRYDWYVVEKVDNTGKTIIVDEEGKTGNYNLQDMYCIPHKSIDWFLSLVSLDRENACKVIASRSAYGNDKPHMSPVKDSKHKYPCIHATTSKGPLLLYSSINDNGHFGISKVIMGKASPEKGFFDKDGIYGVTNNAFAIQVDSEKEGRTIEKAITTNKFRELLEICKWAGFATDNRVFGLFRKDFWREFE